MGFHRAKVVEEGRSELPSRAGVGWTANCTIKSYLAEADETITMPELSGGIIQQNFALTSDVTYTLPTSVLIEAEWPEMDVGDAFSFIVTNAQLGAFDVIIAVGAGQTAIGPGNGLEVKLGASRVFTLVKTSNTTHDLY
ncbi:MAG: hypothetical protein RPT13_03850 [SAR324 cluster bacterium]